MSAIYRSAEGERLVRERYLQFLARWPVPNDQRYLDTREGKTFVVVCGPEGAPSVILLHGAGFNSVTWMGDVVEWSKHFRLYAVDLIGHPGFSAPSRPPYETEAHALWLDDVMAGLGIDRAAFVGLSLGGWTAIDYAARRSGRVQGLALLAPGGVGRQLLTMPKLMLVVLPLTVMGKWGRRKALEMVLGPTQQDDSPAAKAFEDFLSLINRHFRPRLDKLPVFSDETLKSLTMPGLLIVGMQDPLLSSPETIARLKQNAPHVEIVALPDIGHAVVNQTKPVLDFLRRVSGG